MTCGVNEAYALRAVRIIGSASWWHLRPLINALVFLDTNSKENRNCGVHAISTRENTAVKEIYSYGAFVVKIMKKRYIWKYIYIMEAENLLIAFKVLNITSQWRSLSNTYCNFFKGAITWGELSRLSELTRFVELTRFLYLLSIILTFRLHCKRVDSLCRDRGCTVACRVNSLIYTSPCM